MNKILEPLSLCMERTSEAIAEQGSGDYQVELVVGSRGPGLEAWVNEYRIQKLPQVESYDLRSRIKVVVAVGDRGEGCILATSGGDQVTYLRDDIGFEFGDMGLDPPDTGLWIFEGRIFLTDEDHEFRGEWSRLSAESAAKAIAGDWHELVDQEPTPRQRVQEALVALQELIGPPAHHEFANRLGGGTLLDRARHIETLLQKALLAISGGSL